MPSREAFLRTICDRPDDDGPRLVYADWLEEHGDPFGEFIRVQCERARLPRSERDALQRLTARLDELQREHDDAWRARLPHLSGIIWCEFHRGFVWRIEVDTAAQFLQHAPAIFAAAPVQRVCFTSLDAEGAALLAKSEFLQKIALLKNHGTPTTDKGVAALVRSPHIANLRQLMLAENGLTDEAIRAIATSRHLGRLSLLFLNKNRITDVGARLLAESKRLPQLEDVSLTGNELHDAGAAALRERWGERVSL